MLQNGYIPCIDTGKKTRRYTILRKDVLRCARSIDSIEFPQMFSSVKESRKKPNLTAEQCEAYMSHLLAKWRTKPSALTVRAVSELLGYRKQTVARWIAKGHLKSASTHGKPIIAQASSPTSAATTATTSSRKARGIKNSKKASSNHPKNNTSPGESWAIFLFELKIKYSILKYFIEKQKNLWYN